MRTFQAIGDELVETDTPAVVLARMNSTDLDTLPPKPRTATEKPADRTRATVSP